MNPAFESPFIDSELFVRESAPDWEPRAAALLSESPFVQDLAGQLLEVEEYQPGENEDFDDSEVESEASMDAQTYDAESTQDAQVWQESQVPTPQGPLSVAQLAGKLTNLVLWARHPKLTGKTLTAGQKEVAEWNRILADEIRPALHNASTAHRIAQLIFFARNPQVQGRFQQLSKADKKKFGDEFVAIRDTEVKPWLQERLLRGRANSRTLFIVEDDVFRRLPIAVRQHLTDEVAAKFAFVGRKEKASPVMVALVGPDRFPEGYNFSDAVVRLTDSSSDAHVGAAIREQTKNARSAIQRLGIRVNPGASGRNAAVPERLGSALSAKQVMTAGARVLAIPLMSAAVDLPSVVAAIEEETGDKLPADMRKYTDAQLKLFGVALGRAVAHEARHLYHAPHAVTGLGSDAPLVAGSTADFSAADQVDILKAIQALEKQQGTAVVVDTFAEQERAGGLPF